MCCKPSLYRKAGDNSERLNDAVYESAINTFSTFWNRWGFNFFDNWLADKPLQENGNKAYLIALLRATWILNVERPLFILEMIWHILFSSFFATFNFQHNIIIYHSIALNSLFTFLFYYHFECHIADIIVVAVVVMMTNTMIDVGNGSINGTWHGEDDDLPKIMAIK